jgi:hypothetical protein
MKTVHREIQQNSHGQLPCQKTPDLGQAGSSYATRSKGCKLM